ncbi:putative ribonuclease H superfamily [Helianthus annuus]|nr:putative ribonuclease H superfamily [Helianthus annuus]KAJ0487160.1 putative ribonuclease H superfamily [Helianthus annuus]
MHRLLTSQSPHFSTVYATPHDLKSKGHPLAFEECSNTRNSNDWKMIYKVLLSYSLLSKALMKCLPVTARDQRNQQVFELATIYLVEVDTRHGMPTSLISDCKPRFATDSSQGCAQKTFDSRLGMSTTYRPGTDGRAKRTIQAPNGMLRTCVIDHGYE